MCPGKRASLWNQVCRNMPQEECECVETGFKGCESREKGGEYGNFCELLGYVESKVQVLNAKGWTQSLQ